MNQSFSTLLNVCRWISAFLVALGHVRHLVFVDYKYVENKNIFIKGLYFITGLGHEAVVVFFVISGFLVGGLTVRKWAVKICYKDYFAARFSRIYSVLIPALVIGAGLDYVGSSFFNLSEIYTNSSRYHTNSLNFVISNQLDSVTFFGNIFNLQGVLVPVLGSNGPLWSLAYEWWYYVIFAAILGFIFDKNIFIKILSISVMILTSTFLPANVIIWMAIWMMGVCVYLYGESSLPKPPRLIGIAFFLIACVLSRISHNTENLLEPEPMLSAFIRDFGFGLAFSLLLLGYYNLNFNIKNINTHKFLADFSYSIYLFHFPLFVFVIAITHDLFGMQFMRQPDFIGFAYFSSVGAVIYIYGYLMSCITEKHSGTFRTALTSIRIRK